MILKILNQLAALPSRNDKLALLQSHVENDVLKQFFHLALDPMVTFGIKKIPDYVQGAGTHRLPYAFSQLSELVQRTKTGNEGVAHLASILASLNENDAEVIKRIIAKDPRCGVSTTANKVWKGLVFDFPVLKASPYDEKTIKNITFPAYSQTKLDGARIALVVKNGSVTCLSSSGREITTHGVFDCLAQTFDGVVLDGELLVKSADGNFADRKTGNGVVNQAVQGTISPAGAASLHAVLFDLVPLADWKAGKGAETYAVRYAHLASATLPAVCSVVDTRTVDSEAEAVQHFKEMLAAGQEGTILKDMCSTWEGKRKKDQIKFKGILTCDLLVTGVAAGTGKYAGKVGALACQSADGEVQVNVGTGLTDADRDLDFDFYVGKVVEVQYNERICNKTAGSVWSLFLPRFVRVRIDKDVADVINNIPAKG